MKPVKFMISGVLFFVLVGPPVGGVVFLLGIASIGPAEGFARFLPLALLYGYVGGLVPALMAGGFCCATMLAASRYLPKWANASQPIVRFALVAAVAAAFILLYLLAGLRYAKLDGPFLVYLLVLLIPFLVCASFVGWRLVPKLEWANAAGGAQ